jgi:hypothetical protein
MPTVIFSLVSYEVVKTGFWLTETDCSVPRSIYLNVNTYLVAQLLGRRQTNVGSVMIPAEMNCCRKTKTVFTDGR